MYFFLWKLYANGLINMYRLTIILYDITHIMSSIEVDNSVKLEKYYDGRKLRRYLYLLELSEQAFRSSHTNEMA